MEYIYLVKLNVLEAVLFSCFNGSLFLLQFRCMRNQTVHMSHHEEMSQLLKNVDSQITKCSSKKPTDSEACQEQQLKVKVCGHCMPLKD